MALRFLSQPMKLNGRRKLLNREVFTHHYGVIETCQGNANSVIQQPMAVAQLAHTRNTNTKMMKNTACFVDRQR